MKPYHSEAIMVGARNRCACCATKYGRHKGKGQARLNASRAGKRKARAEGRKQADNWLD